tara:strand:+ start:1078 stop:1629 length:552 start_codon:yes stop_codon:yes gene_type:complete
MAIRTVKILGLEVTDATWTVLWDGATVASGAVVAGMLDVDRDCQVVGTWTFEDNGATDITDHSLSVTVNSGMMHVGTLWFSTPGPETPDPDSGPAISTAEDCVGAGYWIPNNVSPFGDGSDTALAERSNILVNGLVPTWGPDMTPSGTAENPTWEGWFFTVAAGDVFTCTGRCPAQWVAPAPV